MYPVIGRRLASVQQMVIGSDAQNGFIAIILCLPTYTTIEIKIECQPFFILSSSNIKKFIFYIFWRNLFQESISITFLLVRPVDILELIGLEHTKTTKVHC